MHHCRGDFFWENSWRKPCGLHHVEKWSLRGELHLYTRLMPDNRFNLYGVVKTCSRICHCGSRLLVVFLSIIIWKLWKVLILSSLVNFQSSFVSIYSYLSTFGIHCSAVRWWPIRAFVWGSKGYFLVDIDTPSQLSIYLSRREHLKFQKFVSVTGMHYEFYLHRKKIQGNFNEGLVRETRFLKLFFSCFVYSRILPSDFVGNKTY